MFAAVNEDLGELKLKLLSSQEGPFTLLYLRTRLIEPLCRHQESGPLLMS